MTTGYVYDEIFTRHDYFNHPENAKRLAAIMNYLTGQAILPQLQQIWFQAL